MQKSIFATLAVLSMICSVILADCPEVGTNPEPDQGGCRLRDVSMVRETYRHCEWKNGKCITYDESGCPCGGRNTSKCATQDCPTRREVLCRYPTPRVGRWCTQTQSMHVISQLIHLKLITAATLLYIQQQDPLEFAHID
jgi:hypothetical protein